MLQSDTVSEIRQLYKFRLFFLHFAADEDSPVGITDRSYRHPTYRALD